MINDLEKNKIYLCDNFFKDYDVIYDFVAKNYKNDTPIYQSYGEIFFDTNFGFPKEWLSLLDEINNIIKEKYFHPCVTKSNALNTVIYEDGAYKAPHRDNFHILTDSNGVQSEEKFNYTSIFYLNNNFIGGKLKFDLLNLSVDPFPGRLVIFPSEFLHSVSRVKYGTRFVISKFWKVKDES